MNWTDAKTKEILMWTNILKKYKTYKIGHQNIEQSITVDKGKQQENQVQDEEILLYKPYDISLKLSKLKISNPIFVQNEVNNLEKYMKFIQSSVKTVPFYPLPHYKFHQSQGEQNKQYWNEVVIKFLKQKHNADITRRGFPIKMYTGGPLHKPYFIVLTL